MRMLYNVSVLLFLTLLSCSTESSKGHKKKDKAGEVDSPELKARFLGSCSSKDPADADYYCEDIFNDGMAGRTAAHEKGVCENGSGKWLASQCVRGDRFACLCSIKEGSPVYSMIWLKADSGSDRSASFEKCSKLSLVLKCRVVDPLAKK